MVQRKVRFPTNNRVNAYWGRLTACVFFVLVTALNAPVHATPHITPEAGPGTQIVQAIAELPQTALVPIEPLEPASIAMVPSAVNTYAWGNCTWGVASWTSVPGTLGNANTWDDFAPANGGTVSLVPVVGAVAQTDAGGLGHVALVEQVSGSTVLIKEMNARGLGVTDERWTPISDWKYLYF